jgi:hypothetical protein
MKSGSPIVTTQTERTQRRGSGFLLRFIEKKWEFAGHCLAVGSTLVITHFHHEQSFYCFIFPWLMYSSFFLAQSLKNHGWQFSNCYWFYASASRCLEVQFFYMRSLYLLEKQFCLCKSGSEKINWLHFLIGMKLKNMAFHILYNI